MTKFVKLRAKTHRQLIDDGSKEDKVKDTKIVSQKKNLNLKIIKTVQKQLNSNKPSRKKIEFTLTFVLLQKKT